MLTCRYQTSEVARRELRTPRSRPSSGSFEKPNDKSKTHRQSLFFFGKSDESPASPRHLGSAALQPATATVKEEVVPKLANFDMNKARESRLAAVSRRLSQVQLPSFSKPESKG